MATGNVATCDTQGFISLVTFIVLELSYTILSILYWILVARGWSEKQTQRRQIRFCFLGVPLIIAICIAAPLLVLGNMNFTGAYSCFVEEYPLNCDIDPETNGECTRGHNARTAQEAIFFGVILCTGIILIFMGLLVRAVRAQESASDR